MFAQLKFMYVHLAMAILCFCPPLSWAPLSPTKVSNFLGSFWINPKAFASLQAFSISSSVTPWDFDQMKSEEDNMMMSRSPSRPNLMFSMMEVAKRTGS